MKKLIEQIEREENGDCEFGGNSEFECETIGEITLKRLIQI